MADKSKPKKKRGPNQITATGRPDKAVGMARTVMRPTVQAAVTLREYGKSFGDLDLTGLIESLTEQTNAAAECDLSWAEAMLAAQAHALDATNKEEIVISAERPVLLNGIEAVVARGDLADRAIFLALKAIPNTERKPESELWVDFERARPQILGALLQNEPGQVWEGTPTALHGELTERVGTGVANTRGWPVSAQALSRRLNQIKSALRPIGIEIEQQKGGRRLMRISVHPKMGVEFRPHSRARAVGETLAPVPERTP